MEFAYVWWLLLHVFFFLVNSLIIKGIVLVIREIWVQIVALPFPSCVTLRKLLDPSELLSPHI